MQIGSRENSGLVVLHCYCFDIVLHLHYYFHVHIYKLRFGILGLYTFYSPNGGGLEKNG